MKWLDVTYSYWERKRNMILSLRNYCFSSETMNSLNVKSISLLNSSFEWIFSLHSLISVSTDSIICDEAIFAWSHSRRENIVKMTIVIHDCECLSSCEKSCVFHARHACLRTTNREVDHFDRFKIEIEFFVRFFLKFIENDRLSWMKNAVDNDWWMRKWVVDKTKMRRWVILDLKDCFFLSFLLKHLLLFIHLLSFFSNNLQKLLKLFIMSFVWKSSSSLNIIKLDRSLSNTLKIVFDKKKNSKCCQRCLKFLTMKSVLQCVFDVDRSICNRCATLNAACLVVRLS